LSKEKFDVDRILLFLSISFLLTARFVVLAYRLKFREKLIERLRVMV
jgi:hypothetical protein